MVNAPRTCKIKRETICVEAPGNEKTERPAKGISTRAGSVGPFSAGPRDGSCLNKYCKQIQS